MDEYFNSIRQNNVKGDALFAVYRGKFEELDFSNENAHSVILIGISYPPVHDTRVVLMREFNATLTGDDGWLWYKHQRVQRS